MIGTRLSIIYLIVTALIPSPFISLFSSANGDDALHDEALESRIAALNLLDLDLAHLGVIVDEVDDTAEIDEAVKEAGQQLQKLESSHAARDKLDHLLRSNSIIAGKAGTDEGMLFTGFNC
jgi:hypothetical protein